MDDWVPKRLLEALGCDAMPEHESNMLGGRPRGNTRAGNPSGGGVPGPARLELPVPDAAASGDAGRNEAAVRAAARAAQTKRDAITAGRIALLQALGLASTMRQRQKEGLTLGVATAMEGQTPQAVRRALRLVHVAVRRGREPKDYYSVQTDGGPRELMTLFEAELVAGIRDLETGHRLAEYAE